MSEHTKTDGMNGTSGTQVVEADEQRIVPVSQMDEKTMRTVSEIATASALATAGNVSATNSEPPPWRLVFPALIGVLFLGILAALSIFGIVFVLSTQETGADLPETYGSQISTGLALLGSLASAAVGGIAGMLTIALGGRASSSGDSN